MKNHIHVLRINALWDDEAGVWSASSDDIHGLAVEAETKEKLIEVLKEVIPVLWELNHTKPATSARAPSRPAASVAPKAIAPIELVIAGRQRIELAL